MVAGALVACSDSTGGVDAGLEDAGPARVWFEEPAATTAGLLSVWGRSTASEEAGFDVLDVWAVGLGGTVLHYDGETWNHETTATTHPLTGVHGRPFPRGFRPGDPEPPVFAVGWDGTILERQLNHSWVPAAMSATVSEDLFGLHVGANDHAVAVGERGRVLAWNGVEWVPVPFLVSGEFSGELIEPKSVLKSVWSKDADRYFLSGSGGASYRSSGGTGTFEALDTRVSEPLRGIWGTGDDNVYVVGLDALILRFSGGWQRIRNNGADELPRVFFLGIDGTSRNDVTVAGWQGVIARLSSGRWGVERTDVDVDLRDVWVARDRDLAFAVGAAGTVLRREARP